MTVEPFLDNPVNRIDIVLGRIDGLRAIQKFGFSDDADTPGDTDIWDGSSLPTSQTIFIPPTAARTHQIASTSVQDAAAGNGARTIEIRGLVDWNTKEVSETITMNGTTNVPTVKQYVIINNMRVVTHGASTLNLGRISATADSDSTLSAQINSQIGYTQTTIHGVPSVQSMFFVDYYGTGVRASQSLSVVMKLKADLDPELFQDLSAPQHVANAQTDGSSYVRHEFLLPPLFVGPKLFKLTAEASANNTSIAGGYDFVLVDNDIILNLLPS